MVERKLDYELIALKLVITGIVYDCGSWDRDRYASDDGDWVPSYAEFQRTLGIYPLSNEEGEAIKNHVCDILGIP